MLILFCAAFVLIVYVYLGYPALLWLGTIGRRESALSTAAEYPSVTIIVAAHNEESCIEEKLLNLLALDYPRDLVEILIGSDGSSDRTEGIVRRFAGDGVGLVSFPQQRGKSAMQNSLAAAASGKILAFTDADCLLPRSALSRLLENFTDSRVGLVSACPRFQNTSETAITENEGTYLRYETWIRERESELGVLAMASGSLFAMRRTLWQPLASHFGDDFVLPLRVIRAGMINRIDPRVIASTDLSQTAPGGMLRMKSRIVSKDFSALLAHRDLLNPFRCGFASIALWSHKLLRWLVPYFLIVLLAANALLLARPYLRAFLSLQIVFYAAGAIGFASRNRRTRLPWHVPMSFCLVNFAALMGTAKALAGRASGVWQPERKVAGAGSFGAAAASRVIK